MINVERADSQADPPDPVALFLVERTEWLQCRLTRQNAACFDERREQRADGGCCLGLRQ